MRKPRLTIVTNNLYSFAGGEKLALEIATGLKNDFEITMLNPVSKRDIVALDRKKLAKLYDLRSLRIVDLENLGVRTKIFVGEPFVLKSLRPGAFANFANEIRKSDIVYVMSLNPLLLLYSLVFTKMFGKKMVLGIHNFSVAKIVKSRETMRKRIIRRNLISLLSQIKYFHVTNNRDLALIRTHFPNAKVSLIPNPIMDEKKPIALNKKEFVCIYLGRLEKSQKGVDLFCRVVERTLSRSSRIKFAVVGAGGDGEAMIAELAKKHAGSVKWPGFLTGKRLEDAYKRASLLAFPSRYDTFSLVLLESQARGIPAVTFDIDGPRDIIKNSFQGVRVPAFDVARFSAEVERYYALWKNKGDYKKVRERIRDSAYANYGKEKVMNDLRSFFKSAL